MRANFFKNKLLSLFLKLVFNSLGYLKCILFKQTVNRISGDSGLRENCIDAYSEVIDGLIDKAINRSMRLYYNEDQPAPVSWFLQ